MNTSSDQVEFVTGSRAARLGAYFFVIALIISGAIFKLQPSNGISSDASMLVVTGLFIAFLAVALGAWYAIYLAVGSMRVGQFPAPHAHVPVTCKVSRGYKAKMSIGLMTLAGIGLATFAVLIISFLFS